MSEATPTGPEPTPPPSEPSPKPTPAPSEGDERYAFYLKSPWAKMFKGTGAEPTLKQIKAIINGVLNSVIQAMKRQDEETKKAMEHLRRVIEGKDD